MIICISGLVGSGKDTIADIVAEKLNLKRIKPSFKDVAKEMGIPLMDYHKYIEKDLTIDREFDNKVAAEAKEGNAVVSTWLGPWTVKDATLRVWLDATEDERAKRIASRDNISFVDALKHLREREIHNRGRYLTLYGIDILKDRSVFDLIINSENFNQDQIAEIIINTAKTKNAVKIKTRMQ